MHHEIMNIDNIDSQDNNSHQRTHLQEYFSNIKPGITQVCTRKRTSGMFRKTFNECEKYTLVIYILHQLSQPITMLANLNVNTRMDRDTSIMMWVTVRRLQY